MSKTNISVEISSPVHTPHNKESPLEVIQLHNLECNYCNGRGWFWGDNRRDTEVEYCPICGGSGKLNATVTIEWHPITNK